MSNSSNNDRLKKLIDCGAEIAGGATAGVIGFLAGGPVGAAALGAGGAVAAMALKHVGTEVSERLLAPREKARVGGVLAIAATKIQQRTEAGDKLRSDGFFDAKSDGRSDAEEIAESVLLKSQREAEEKKLAYMGNLLANIAFESRISAQMAHQITKVAEQLTYRQLCLMKLAVIAKDAGLRAGDYRGVQNFSKELYQVLYECLDLYHRALINFGGEVAFGPTDVASGKMVLQALGIDIFNLMRLGNIPNEDLIPIIAQLK